MKIAAVIVGVFIAAFAYLEYHRIINVDWETLQTVSQNTITTFANTLTHLSNNIGADHTGVTANLALSNLGIPLASSASAGFALVLLHANEFQKFFGPQQRFCRARSHLGAVLMT
jgi:uncharacterized membrane protein (Fun14 family)